VISDVVNTIGVAIGAEDGSFTNPTSCNPVTRLDPGEANFAHDDFTLPPGRVSFKATACAEFTDAAGNRWVRDARHRLLWLGRAKKGTNYAPASVPAGSVQRWLFPKGPHWADDN
jgi:hypothetical protein